MRVQSFAVLLAAAATASAQSVSGKAYGFAAGVTGGEGEAVTPSTAEELAKLLADDTPRVIYIDKEFDFTGDVKTGPGCDRKSCSASNGGQLYLGDLSCGGDDNVAVSSISYDVAGTEPLPVGSNKSIIGNGKAVLKGKGLSLKKGSSNVIIQGIEITNLNPGVVWGGDSLELRGLNDGVWIDHCKFSKVGRMFIVSHYDGSRLTISNSEFDGVTDTSASCNGNHYWTMMFYGEGDKVTLDRNHFHDVAGRAPKLGEPGTNGYFHATNNYFQNMKGHAFDAYQGANAIIEGNVFDGVDTPVTKEGAAVSTLFIPDESAAAACQSALGRACEPNSATSSGDLPIMSGESGLNALAEHKDNIITPVSASGVAALVISNAGPANVGSGSAPAGGSESGDNTTETTPTAPETTPEATPQTTSDAIPEATTPQATPETAPEQEQSVPEVEYDEQVEPVTQTETKPVATGDCEEEVEESTPVVEQPTSESDCEEEAAPSAKAEVKPVANGDECDSEDTPKTSASESSSPATPSKDSLSSGSSSVQMYGQCGGKDFTGSTKCASGATCKKFNEYYSQCIGSNSRVRRYVQV